jgi:outer membrane usher protein
MIASKHAFLILTLAIALGSARNASAWEDVKGPKTSIEVNLLANGKKKTETSVNIYAKGRLIEIPGDPVLFALTKIVSKDLLIRLEKSIDGQGLLSNKLLAKFGIILTFNGPLKQVNLEVTENGQNESSNENKQVESPTIKTIPKPTSTHSKKVMDDSGPWTTPPKPSLPGKEAFSQDSKLDDKDTIPAKDQMASDVPTPLAPQISSLKDSILNDKEWEPLKSDGPKKVLDLTGAKLKPEGELQTYRFDRTRDELFEDIFKHKAPPLPPSIEVTLLVDGKSYGTLWILYSDALKKYTFPVDPVLNALQGLVRQDLWDRLAKRAKLQSRFTVEDLIECGFPTVLNTSVFELSTGIPSQLIGTKIHPISGQVIDPYTIPAFEASALSAYVNTRIRERVPYYQYNPSPYDTNGFGKKLVEGRNSQPRQPIIVDLDGAINVKSWVLEGRAILWEKVGNDGVRLQRQGIRMVHDWPKKALRLSAGDLIFPTSGYQAFLNIGGIGLSRDLSLQPHLAAYPVKELEFFLTSPSEVKVYINGALRADFPTLEAGTHDLRKFPFTNGESDVEIQITDNTGQTQTLNFSFIHEPSLLAKGNSAFSYNIGFPSRDLLNTPPHTIDPARKVILNYEYDTEHPILFLDYRRGITNTLTLAAYSQAQDTAGMIGADILKAIKIGKIKADIATSYRHNTSPSWAGNLEYTYIPKITSQMSPTSWRLQTEYIGETFFRPGQDTSLLGALSFSGSYQSYAKLVNLNLGASYIFRPDRNDFYNLFAGINRSWGKGWSSALTFKNSFDRSKFTNTSVAANVNYNFNYDLHSFAASERIENHRPDGTEKGPPPSWDYTTDLLWDYNASGFATNTPALNLTSSFGPKSNDYSTRAELNTPQGNLQIMGRRYEPKDNSIITNNVDLTLQSALVFVDGNFALSKRISNSFVLIKGIENEKHCEILANPNEISYEAKSTRWLNGVIPNISPYYLKKVHLEVKDPPFGSNDDRTEYTIFPSYKSGYAFYLGTKATIIALGTLLLAPGVPVQYQTFKAVSIDKKDVDPIVGFTNGAGKFQLTRLQAGKYNIEIEIDGVPHSAKMTLPTDAEGIKPIGTLTLTPTATTK